MPEVSFIYPTPEGSKEIILESDEISFGRGSIADIRFPDDGLSRLNSTVYRENEKLWIIDENSTNGTFVNGLIVGKNGTPLKNGDLIKIGNETEIRVRIIEKNKTTSAKSLTPKSSEKPKNSSLLYLLPITITLFALFVVGVSALVIIWKMQEKNNPEIVDNNENFNSSNFPQNNDEEFENKNTSVNLQTTPKPLASNNLNKSSNQSPANLTESPAAKDAEQTPNFPTGKKYLEMSESEQRRYIESRAAKVARMIGNRDSGTIPPLAIEKIKGFLDGYAKRFRSARTDNCSQGTWVRSDLATVYERASRNAPFIVRSFNSEGIDPQIGLYLAMIESEHCVCLQSPTGPLGMFQFTKATGEAYGLQTFRGASPANPDERCKPEPASRAAAKYMKFLTGRYGTDPSSVPLAIGSYNSGEGGLSTNLKTALEANEGLERNFWTLIANGEKLSKQFQSENFKYVPKFFAAAIIGENPQDFGLNLQPLSTYTN